MNGQAPTMLLYGVTVAVTIVWMIVAISSIITHDYQPLIIVTPLMIAIVTYVTGFKIGRRNGNNS